MKKFLFRGFVFAIILIGFFSLNFVINFFIYKNQKVYIKEKLLIAGDSHSKRGINPKILGNAVNVSQQGEPYYITFWKLKKMFKDNKIDTLILSFAPHNIAEFNDLKLSNERWSGEMFKRIYPLQEFNELSDIDIDYVEYYKVLLKETGFYPKRNHINYRGEYFNSKKTNLLAPKESVEKQFYDSGEQLGISTVSLQYLDSILFLCKTYKVKLILVSSPVHSSYFYLIPKPILDKYKTLKKAFAKRNEVKVIDKTNLFYPDSLYFDVHHLNELGATRFSIELKEELKNNKN